MSVLPKMPSTHVLHCGVERLGQDIFGSNVDKPHLAVLNHFMRKALPGVDVLGALPAPDDVVPHSMHEVLSSYTGVGDFWAKPMFSRRLQR